MARSINFFLSGSERIPQGLFTGLKPIGIPCWRCGKRSYKLAWRAFEDYPGAVRKGAGGGGGRGLIKIAFVCQKGAMQIMRCFESKNHGFLYSTT